MVITKLGCSNNPTRAKRLWLYKKWRNGLIIRKESDKDILIVFEDELCFRFVMKMGKSLLFQGEF